MRGNQIQTKKGGGFKTVIFFIVGIILGIAITVGAIVGGTYYVLNTDVDRVLGMFGVDNSVDEQTGKNKYVNTNPEAGGVSSLLDLVSKVTSLASSGGNLTLGQIDDLVPATRGLVDQVASAVQKYVVVDYEELREIKFAELGTYIKGVVMDIQPAVFMADLNLEGSVNTVLEKVLMGVEANVVTSPTGEVFPLYVDNFTFDEETQTYKRVEDGAALLTSQNDYVIKQSADNNLYDVFFFEYQGNRYISQRAATDVFDFSFTADDGHLYTIYNEENCECTGNYYISGGEKQIIEPITIGSLASGGLGALEKLRVLELIGGEGEPDEMLVTILGDVSIGDLMNGNVDFQAKVNGLELGSFLTLDPFKDSMLLYFAYGITGLSAAPDGEGRYTATYKLGESDIPAYVKIEEGKVVSVTNQTTGEQLKGTTVESINNTIDKIEISIFVEVTTENAILPYLAYGITGLKEGEDGKWTAQLGEDPCEITVDAETKKITAVKNTVTGENVPAAGIDELSGRVNNVTKDLTIGDIVPANGNKILEQLSGSTIDGLSDTLDKLELGAILDVPADNAILTYLAYGVTDVKNINTEALTAEGTFHTTGEGAEVEKTVYLTLEEVPAAEEGGDPTYNVTGVYYDSDHERPVEGTTINGINGKLDGLTKNLKIKDVVEIKEGDRLMAKLGEYAINDVGDAINELTLPDVMTIPNSAIMAYLAYGITGVEITGDGTTGTAKLGEDTVYLTLEEVPAEGDGEPTYNITGVYYDSAYERPVEETKINDVGGKVDGLTETLKIKDIIEIGEGDRLMEKIGGYTINDVGKVVEVLQITDVMEIPADSTIMAYLAYGITEVNETEGTAKLGGESVTLTIEDGNITAVTRADGSEVEGAYVQQQDDGKACITDRVNSLTNDLKIKDVVTIGADASPLLKKIGEYEIANVGDAIDAILITDVMTVRADSAIMAYLAYGITEVNETEGTATLHEEETTVQVTLTIEGGNITSVKKEGGIEVEGTKVNELNGKIDGLMEDLTIGELIGEQEGGGAILDAISGSTIKGLGSAIDNITLNELYADEIYKPVNHKEEGAYTAPWYEAVSGEPQDAGTKIKFSTAYIYYTKDENGSYHLVQMEGKDLGKLDSLPSGTYYTHGAPTKMWQLILCENGNEQVKKLNDIGGIITSVTETLTGSTLYALDAAGILNFEDGALDKKISLDGKTLGEYTLTEALAYLAKLAII